MSLKLPKAKKKKGYPRSIDMPGILETKWEFWYMKQVAGVSPKEIWEKDPRWLAHQKN